MKNLSSIFYLLLMTALPVSAQKLTFSGERDTIRFNVNIGESSNNSFTKGKAAEISALFPGSDTVKRSWLVNSYLEVGILSDSSRWSLGLVGEFHKNTLVAKVQDVRQYGISLGKVFMKRAPLTGASVCEVPLTLSLKYSEDRISKTETFQAVAGVQFNRFQGPVFLKTQSQFPRIESSFGKMLGFSHNHNIGLAYLGVDESVLLGQFDFELNAYILPFLSDRWIHKTDLFKLQVQYNARTPLLGNTELDMNSLITFHAGINYAIDKKNSIELAYNWIQGADPLNGLKDQDYESISAKVKISF